MDLTTVKTLILFVTLASTVAFGVFPMFFVERFRNARWMGTMTSLSTTFSGGVFLAACIMDLFPDVKESMDHLLDEIENQYHVPVDYPLAEFIILVGFFLILIVENIVAECQEHMKQGMALNVPANPDDERRPLLAEQRQTETAQPTTTDAAIEHHHEGEHQHQHDHDHLPLELFVHSTLRATLLCLALSFHSLFEGLAIGLQTTLGNVWSIFFAVTAHKGIMAFSLGLTIAQTNLKMRIKMLAVAIFSIASPIGIAIGIGVTDMPESIGRDIANSSLQGISCGTFLYIALLEVLFPELSNPNNRMPKILTMLLGFSLISVLLMFTH